MIHFPDSAFPEDRWHLLVAGTRGHRDPAAAELATDPGIDRNSPGSCRRPWPSRAWMLPGRAPWPDRSTTVLPSSIVPFTEQTHRRRARWPGREHRDRRSGLLVQQRSTTASRSGPQPQAGAARAAPQGLAHGRSSTGCVSSLERAAAQYVVDDRPQRIDVGSAVHAGVWESPARVTCIAECRRPDIRRSTGVRSVRPSA